MIFLKDNLNVEVVLGIVINVKEVIVWFGYIYFFVCMLKNFFVYGMFWEEVCMYFDKVYIFIIFVFFFFWVNMY